MADIRHYRNDTLVNPREFESLQITMDWLNRKIEATINIDALIFVGDEGIVLRQRYLSGLFGGVGVFEGEPYRIEIGQEGNPTVTFEGYLDFTKDVQFIGCDEIQVALQRKQGTDWLNDVADGFSFRFLESEDIINDDDFFSIPYVINYIPDGVQLLLLAITTFSLVKELIEAIKATANRISDLTDAATPVIGVGAGLGVTSNTGYDIGNIILAALKLIAQVAYLAAIVYAIVKLVEQIIEELMPVKRFHLGIGYRTLFQRACDHLNLRLQSTLLDELDIEGEKWVYMPRKNHRGGERPTGASSSWRETGVTSSSSPIDTFGGLIRVMKKKFNADFKIVNGVFIFERRDYFRTNSPYVIPAIFTDQERLLDANGFNTSEMKANYNINYSFDVQDQNTLDNTNGLAFQAQLTPKVVNNKDLLTFTGLEEIAIPFSLAVRKNQLTAVEEAVKVFATLADSITGQLGNPSSLSGKINNRIGAMHLSSHFTSVPKVVIMAGNNLAKDQRDIAGASNLWFNYHYLNSFAPNEDGIHNQYYLYKEQPISFCFEDFVSLVGNNLVVTEDGLDAEIERLTWDVWDNKAVIDYRVNKLYTNNFEIKYL
jgi:hypothetical protein